ncbi:uncharacterized protein ACA1_201770, partial [Acanthamoeba castellanii str. Neff]
GHHNLWQGGHQRQQVLREAQPLVPILPRLGGYRVGGRGGDGGHRSLSGWPYRFHDGGLQVHRGHGGGWPLPPAHGGLRPGHGLQLALPQQHPAGAGWRDAGAHLVWQYIAVRDFTPHSQAKRLRVCSLQIIDSI